MTNLSQETDQLELRVAELERRVAELEGKHDKVHETDCTSNLDIFFIMVLLMLLVIVSYLVDMKSSIDDLMVFSDRLESKVRFFEGRINDLEDSEIEFRRVLATCKI